MPEQVSEENWFFRLSRYAAPLREAITTGRLRIEPAGRRHEVLALIDAGLADFSVSRPAERAGGWGIPVPGDPGQVIYVWFDALCNYVTALGYGHGGEADGAAQGEAYQRWWAGRETASTCSARACCGSTPSTGRPCCCRPGSRCRPTSSCTTT